MTRKRYQQHQQRHVELHDALDELCADYYRHTGLLFSESTILDLMVWSADQADNPTDPPKPKSKR